MSSRIAALLLSLPATLAVGAQELHVNDSGTWREIGEVYVNDSGTWREIQEIYVNNSGTWELVFRATLHETTITVGQSGGTTFGYSDPLGFGSIGDDTYVDRSSITNTIGTVRWDNTNQLVLMLSAGSAPPNTDDTFEEIVVNGTTFSRASASYGTGGATASWTWTSVSVPFSGLGNVDQFVVR